MSDETKLPTPQAMQCAALLFGKEGLRPETVGTIAHLIDRETNLPALLAIEKAVGLCEKHKPTGGARNCVLCGLERQLVSISEIASICEGNPEVTAYDVHCNEREVVGQVAELYAELADLRRWKTEVMAVERQWDDQKVAQLLGLRLGTSVRAGIQPAVEKLIAERARLLDQIHNDGILLARAVAGRLLEINRADEAQARIAKLEADAASEAAADPAEVMLAEAHEMLAASQTREQQQRIALHAVSGKLAEIIRGDMAPFDSFQALSERMKQAARDAQKLIASLAPQPLTEGWPGASKDYVEKPHPDVLRLDWLEKHGATPICSRAAIDAAMKGVP